MSLIQERIKAHCGVKVHVICIRKIPSSNLDPDFDFPDPEFSCFFFQAIVVNTGVVPSLDHDSFLHILPKLFCNSYPAIHKKSLMILM